MGLDLSDPLTEKGVSVCEHNGIDFAFPIPFPTRRVFRYLVLQKEQVPVEFSKDIYLHFGGGAALATMLYSCYDKIEVSGLDDEKRRVIRQFCNDLILTRRNISLTT